MAAPKRQPIQLFKSPDFSCHQNAEYAFTRPAAERALIGAILVNPDMFRTVKTMLGHVPNMFTDRIPRDMWVAMCSLDSDNQPIDPALLIDRLVGVMDRQWWTQTLQKIVFDHDASHAHNILHYAQSVQAAYTRRQLDQHLLKLRHQNANGKLPDAMVPEFGQSVTELCRGLVLAPLERAGESILVEHDREVQERQNNPNAPRLTIPTGFRKLDDLFGGWQKGMLHVIGGLPNMGKTGVMLSCVLHAARRGIRCDYYGFADGSRKRTVARFLGMMSGIPSNLQLDGTMNATERKQYNHAVQEFARLPIYIDDQETSPIGMEKKLRSADGLGLVFVDYYQRMTTVNPETGEAFKNDYDTLVQVSKDLVNMGKALHVPLIVGAQVPAHVAAKKDPRPEMYDVSDCKRIIHDADCVVYVHRPHKLDPMECATTAELIVRKLRMAGREATAMVHFDTTSGLFSTGELIDPQNDVPF